MRINIKRLNKKGRQQKLVEKDRREERRRMRYLYYVPETDEEIEEEREKERKEWIETKKSLEQVIQNLTR